MTPEITSDRNQYQTPREHRRERYSLTGPIILVTLGVMFLAGQFIPGWGISKTWPVLLIVIGVAKLLETISPRGTTPPG